MLLSSFLASSINVSFGIASLSVNFWALSFKTSEASTYFFPCSSIVFICFPNALRSREYINLACSIILLRSDGNISPLVRYSHLSILSDDNANILLLLC